MIIRAVVPIELEGVWVRRATMTSDTCLTEAHVMSYFKSVWCKQIIIIITP